MPRRPFVFSLLQNFSPQFLAKQMAYEISPDGIIERLSPIFFIGIGIIKIITGPYELIDQEIIYDSIKPPIMTRINEPGANDGSSYVYGIWEKLRVSCPYLVTFRSMIPIKKGLVWEYFCNKYGVQNEMRSTLVKVELDEDQIKDLANYLTKINTESATLADYLTAINTERTE